MTCWSLGPVANSRSSDQLRPRPVPVGEPGNGKTSIAERVTRAFGKPMWIPRALLADGHVIRVYDPAIHVPVDPSSEEYGGVNVANT